MATDKSNRDGRKTSNRTVLVSDVLEVFKDTAAFLTAQGIVNAVRGLGQTFQTKLTVANPGVQADSVAINGLMKQLEQNVDALELPTETKQEMKIALVSKMLDQVAALNKASDTERSLLLFKIRNEMAAEITKLRQKRQAFHVRVIEVLSDDDRKQFISWQTALNPTQKPRWLAIRESVESPIVLMAVINDAVDAEQALVALETMIAKPTVPKLSPEHWVEKFAKDNPIIGKTIKHAAVHLDLIADPIPRMTPAQDEAEYRAIVTPLIASEKERDERIKSEARRVQIEASRDERARKEKNFVQGLSQPRSALPITPMRDTDTRDSYRKLVRKYFKTPAQLDAHVNAECTRLGKP